MKQALDEHRFFYVDETGDPGFYGKGKKLIVGNEGCSRTFGVGFLRTPEPDSIRQKLAALRAEVAVDRYLKDVPSIRKTLKAFHAKDDCPEVRKLVFGCLDELEFSIQIVVARKLESIFKGKHGLSQDAFYNDLTSHLFERQLHLASQNTILFARRGNKTQQHALRGAVEAGVVAFRKKYPDAVATKVTSRRLTRQMNRCCRQQTTPYGRFSERLNGGRCGTSTSLHREWNSCRTFTTSPRFRQESLSFSRGRIRSIFKKSAPWAKPPKRQRHEADIHQGELTLPIMPEPNQRGKTNQTGSSLQCAGSDDGVGKAVAS